MAINKNILIFLFYLSLSGCEAFASTLYSDLYLASRSKGMGGASVAVVDDADSIWLNPAGLATLQKSEVRYLAVDLEASQDIYSAYTTQSEAFKKPSISNFNKLMGYNNYGRAQFAPSLAMPNFGLGVLIDGQAAFYAKNPAFPQITMGYQNTNGVQAAFGFSTRKRKSVSARVNRGELRWGVAAKLLWRRGGYYPLSTMDLLNLTQGQSFLSNIVGNYEMGLGVDTGMQYAFSPTRQSEVAAGAAFLDMGDTAFGGKAQRQSGNLAAGVGYKYRGSIMGFRFAYDFRNILQDWDWRLKHHLGGEVSILSRFTLQLGLNQSYLTGGFVFDLWYLRASVVTYAEELGHQIHQDPSRRYLLSFDLKFEL